MIPYMVCLADREFCGHSYRQHASHLQTRQGTLRMCGLKTAPSKSCLHHAATIITDYGWLHELIEKQAGRHVLGSLLGDSTGVAINQYADWEDAKRGLISRREFVRLHVMVDTKGSKIASCAVTRGRAHDSPVFREMFERVPDGTRCLQLAVRIQAPLMPSAFLHGIPRPHVQTGGGQNYTATGMCGLQVQYGSVCPVTGTVCADCLLFTSNAT